MGGSAFGNEEIQSLQSEIDALKKGQDEIKKDLKLIKDLLEPLKKLTGQAEEPFKPVDVTIEGSPVLGKTNAPIILLEFTDYQCPYCRRHVINTYPKIIKDYVDTGKVKYIIREFPLKQIHPNAENASKASLCAGEQDGYWKMHDLIFQGRQRMGKDVLLGYAEKLKLNMDLFQSCFNSDKYEKQINRDVQDGGELGVQGTPSFIFGKTDAKNPNKFKAIQFLRGAHPYNKFKKVIEDLLKGA